MYYIPTPEDNKRATIFTIVMIILFTIICFVMAPAQITRGTDIIDGKEVVCKTPSSYFTLVPLNTTDSVFVTVLADSIGNDVYAISLYCFFPYNKKAPEAINLWYPDKTKDEFKLDEGSIKGSSARYNIVGHSLENIFRKRFIAFEVKGLVYYENYQGEEYFTNFFASYNK